ncbi:hypothetical protein BN1200_380084 [Klebsiella variicola]|nr:hypothetical protein BN1200_380084 [Klebsiella variicola]
MINIFETRINACNISNLSSLCQIADNFYAAHIRNSLILKILYHPYSNKSNFGLIAFVCY